MRLSRRDFMVGAVGVLGAGPPLLGACAAGAKQPTRVAHVGLFGPAVGLPLVRDGLAEFGYVEGQNLVIEFREDLREDRSFEPGARELAALPLDVIVAANIGAARAANVAATTTPIVAVGSGGSDLLASGLITSLARPGGNVTGLTYPPSLGGKLLQLLVESVPGATRIGFMYQSPGQSDRIPAMESMASQLGLRLIPLPVQTTEDIEGAVATAVGEQADALYIINGYATARAIRRTADLALRSRLPSIYENRGAVLGGGLMCYGPNASEQYRRVAYYVDRILKGAKPADLPVEQPMTFDFVVNMKTAQALGITFPNEIMLQVTEVIDQRTH